jgi:hypothetical protein
MENKSNLMVSPILNSGFATKALAAAALAGAGLYLYSQHKDEGSVEHVESKTASWSVPKNVNTLMIIWVVVLAVLAYVWHVVCDQLLAQGITNSVNLIMCIVLVLLFCAVVAFTGEDMDLCLTKYMLGAASIAALFGAVHLWRVKHYHGSYAVGLVAAFFAYRTAALYSVKKEDLAEISESY